MRGVAVRLHGPLQAWGGPAIGDDRPTCRFRPRAACWGSSRRAWAFGAVKPIGFWRWPRGRASTFGSMPLERLWLTIRPSKVFQKPVRLGRRFKANGPIFATRRSSQSWCRAPVETQTESAGRCRVPCLRRSSADAAAYRRALCSSPPRLPVAIRSTCSGRWPAVPPSCSRDSANRVISTKGRTSSWTCLSTKTSRAACACGTIWRDRFPANSASVLSLTSEIQAR